MNIVDRVLKSDSGFRLLRYLELLGRGADSESVKNGE